jgi:hypothetical protein
VSYVYYPKIGIYSTSSAVPFTLVKRLTDAVGRATYYDYGYWWGNTASIYAFRSAAEIPQGYWRIKISDDPHTAHGTEYAWGVGEQPAGWVYAGGCQPRALTELGTLYDDAGAISHEVLEMMSDPWGGGSNASKVNKYVRWIYSPDGCTPWTNPSCGPNFNKWVYGTWPNEVCDIVYNWSYRYPVSSTVGGGYVLVSDFITPYWWDRDTPKQWYTKYDHLNGLSQAMTFSWWQEDSHHWGGIQAGGLTQTQA